MNTINRAIQNGTIKKSKTGFPLKSSVEKVKRSFGASLKVPKKKKATAKEKGKGKAVGSASPPPNREKTPSPPIRGLMKIGANRAGPSRRWANYSNNESPSPIKKRSPSPNSNENFNYFMKGPRF